MSSCLIEHEYSVFRKEGTSRTRYLHSTQYSTGGGGTSHTGYLYSTAWPLVPGYRWRDDTDTGELPSRRGGPHLAKNSYTTSKCYLLVSLMNNIRMSDKKNGGQLLDCKTALVAWFSTANTSIWNGTNLTTMEIQQQHRHATGWRHITRDMSQLSIFRDELGTGARSE